MKITIGTMYSKVDFLGNTLLRERVQEVMHHQLGIKVDGAMYSRAYRNGVWDGITDFYDMKEDKFHTGLLPQFLDGIRKLQEKDHMITYELEDTRPPKIISPDDIDEEIILGNGDQEPIILRDYQYESVKKVLEDQVGIVNLATNAGKTETAAGVMQQMIPYLKKGERIAFFTHSKEIFNQSAERISKRLKLTERQVGKIGDGKFDIKNKQIVFVMVPTLNSALKDPKKGIKFTQKENVIKFIAEQIAPKFKNTANTRQLLRNYIKNCSLTTRVWQLAQEQLEYIAYDKKFTDKTAQMQLNKYVVEFDKIMEKKNKTKYKKYKETLDFLDSVKVMIADECHHGKADTWFNSLSLCSNSSYRVGLTGTVDKKDKMSWQRLQALFGGVISRVSNDFLINKGISSKPTIRVVPIKQPSNIEIINNYLEAYKLGIVENDHRNEVIVKLVAGYKKAKPGGILVSVKEIDHGDRILEMLQDIGLDVDFIHGGSESDHRINTLDKFSKGELDIMIASTIIDEGVDMKSIGCMVLAAGGKSMRQQLQRIGRGLRLNGIDGNKVMVFDFYDQTNKYLLNHSKERIKIFKEESFDVKILGE
ncbi:DNA helicase [Bacillus phage Shbh1]|uniref:Recombination helicase-like protein n=1 Tax=Bacillus phage Shbh1 TaxID=1796992 RepID=A0A142F1G5_9CAUD|nr:DNA helicase [Bacillus phage Shbh1]AMQ66622.1 recombination helicase-like protein [Bacillus phage Shbh1]